MPLPMGSTGGDKPDTSVEFLSAIRSARRNSEQKNLMLSAQGLPSSAPALTETLDFSYGLRGP